MVQHPVMRVRMVSSLSPWVRLHVVQVPITRIGLEAPVMGPLPVPRLAVDTRNVENS